MSDTFHPPATCCILYTTDPTYLFPTFVSALQARRHASPQKADVIIFCLDLDPETLAIFGPICTIEGIGLIALDGALIEGQSAMLARLFLNRFVPPRYSDYIYLDGDVHILNSLDPLISVEVPPGSFLAANDPMTFLLDDNTPLSKDMRAHLHSIGLTPAEALQYFNSGVLRIRADSWAEIGRNAWQYFEQLGHGSRFPDQDALNLAGRGHRLPLSLAWNYPVFLRHSRVEVDIRPHIKHFMSSPKPWNGSFPPWTQKECKPYDHAVKSYPGLGPFRPRSLSSSDHVYHRLHQNGKRLIETVTWGLSKRRQRILRYEDACVSVSQTYVPEPAFDTSQGTILSL
jgi:lipopolysaccharide biosynthesis glycosyltransferase